MEKTINVFAKGERKEKVYNGKIVLATPIAYDDGYCMGVGLRFNDAGKLYGVSPRHIITSYRAMMIAESVGDFTDRTLHDCWETARYWPNAVSDNTQRAFEEIRERVDKQRIREILQMFPENVEQILKMSKEEWDFDGFEEVEEEIRTGNIQLTPTIDNYFMEFQRYKLGERK